MENNTKKLLRLYLLNKYSRLLLEKDKLELFKWLRVSLRIENKMEGL